MVRGGYIISYLIVFYIEVCIVEKIWGLGNLICCVGVRVWGKMEVWWNCELGDWEVVIVVFWN